MSKFFLVVGLIFVFILTDCLIVWAIVKLAGGTDEEIFVVSWLCNLICFCVLLAVWVAERIVG